MKLIVGLGNPGWQYKNTRHNIWFWVIDKLRNDEWKILWDILVYDNKLGWETIQTILDDKKVIFTKPMEFMNRSWWCVSKIANFYKIDTKDILVIHDDIDLTVWTIKLKLWWWAAGHNGIRNIMDKLGNGEFYRIRIWVDRPNNQDYVADYVLSNFKKEEIDIIETKFDQIEKFIKEFLNK